MHVFKIPVSLSLLLSMTKLRARTNIFAVSMKLEEFVVKMIGNGHDEVGLEHFSNAGLSNEKHPLVPEIFFDPTKVGINQDELKIFPFTENECAKHFEDTDFTINDGTFQKNLIANYEVEPKLTNDKKLLALYAMYNGHPYKLWKIASIFWAYMNGMITPYPNCEWRIMKDSTSEKWYKAPDKPIDAIPANDQDVLIKIYNLMPTFAAFAAINFWNTNHNNGGTNPSRATLKVLAMSGMSEDSSLGGEQMINVFYEITHPISKAMLLWSLGIKGFRPIQPLGLKKAVRMTLGNSLNIRVNTLPCGTHRLSLFVSILSLFAGSPVALVFENSIDTQILLNKYLEVKEDPIRYHIGAAFLQYPFKAKVDNISGIMPYLDRALGELSVYLAVFYPDHTLLKSPIVKQLAANNMGSYEGFARQALAVITQHKGKRILDAIASLVSDFGLNVSNKTFLDFAAGHFKDDTEKKTLAEKIENDLNAKRKYIESSIQLDSMVVRPGIKDSLLLKPEEKLEKKK